MKVAIIGRAGTGKTTYLLDKILQLDPKRTIYISYTRKAVWEARERASKKFGLEKDDIQYFRTIHSLCYRLLGYTKEMCLKTSEIKEFFDKKGIKFSPEPEVSEGLENEVLKLRETGEDMSDGNRILGMLDYIQHTSLTRIEKMNDRELMIKINGFINGFGKFESVYLNSPSVLLGIVRDYQKMKLGKVDYTDILLDFLETPSVPEEVEYLVVDEFQDLTPLMYEIVKIFESHTKDQFYAGDDIQTIYTFMGSKPDFLISEYNGTNNKVDLKKSWRMRENVWEFAKRFIKRNIKKRTAFLDIKTRGAGGRVVITGYDLKQDFFKKFENTYTLFLHRTNREKRMWKRMFIGWGIRFKEIGLGKRIWTTNLDNLYNALLKIKKGLPLNYDETRNLVESIPTKPFLIRGVKTKLRKGIYRQPLTQQARDFFQTDEINTMFFEKEYGLEYILSNLNLLRIEKDQLNALKIKILTNPNEIITDPDTVHKKCIVLSTIHSVKGGEADIVILNTKISKRITSSIIKNKEKWEEEARVFGIGLTRAREATYLMKTDNPLFKNAPDVASNSPI